MCILWFHRPRHSRCRPTSCARSVIRSDHGNTSSLRSAQPVFIGSGNCDVSGDHWIQSQRRRWSMPSLLLASTTVMYTAGASKATNVLLVIRVVSSLKLGCFQSGPTHAGSHFMAYKYSRLTYFDRMVKCNLSSLCLLLTSLHYFSLTAL